MQRILCKIPVFKDSLTVEERLVLLEVFRTVKPTDKPFTGSMRNQVFLPLYSFQSAFPSFEIEKSLLANFLVILEFSYLKWPPRMTGHLL